MTRGDILRIAQETGAIPIHKDYKQKALVGNENIERFAALIASRVAAAAKAEEREACAKVCDDLTVTDGLHQAKYCANAIRARGETK